MSGIGPGSLKCIVFQADALRREALCSVLRRRIGPDNVRQLDAEALLVFTDATAAEIRDWLAPVWTGAGWIFVCKFEKWSGYGQAIDRQWLLARGH